MKTLRCWDRVIDPVNLWRAWREFASGKRRRPDVAAFDLDAAVHVVRIALQLASGRYRPGPYRLLRIADPKRRLVAAAPVRDRVVHHAVHRVVAPWWNRSFSEHSFACLAGRGSHRAVLRFRGELHRWRHVILLDMCAYFYSIDRAVLAGLLARRLPEPTLRDLLVEARDRMGAWLREERGLELKDADARPRRTDRQHDYLGYRVSRCGIGPGLQMRSRVVGHVAERDPEQLHASVSAMAAAWTFG